MNNNDTYFNLMSEAIDHARQDAVNRGFEVVDNMFAFEPVSYGQTKKTSLNLLNNGKEQKRMLHISLFRMESGRYELTHYIN
jgi:hypothetical protein